MSNEAEKNAQTQLMLDALYRENQELKQIINQYENKTPIVGVRWFGRGQTRINMHIPLNGSNNLYLSGYNAKGVITYEAWNRLAKSNIVHEGTLVRDDSVIEEIGITGKIGNPTPKSENAFLVSEIESLLKGSVKALKEALDNCTQYFPCDHFMRIAEEIELNDSRKLRMIRDRYDYLYTKFKYSLLDGHDLASACDANKIPHKGRYVADIIEDLVRLELQQLKNE